MSYISLRKDYKETEELVKGPNRVFKYGDKSWYENVAKILSNPVRVRIIVVLIDVGKLTQRELGKKLSLANASIHFHLKKLTELGLVKLHSTRNGPNGIVEKLFLANKKRWDDFLESPYKNEDVGFYLQYAISWLSERNREGKKILEEEKRNIPFLAGSYTINVTADKAIEFKQKLEYLCMEFFNKNNKNKQKNNSFAVTFALLPSNNDKHEESLNVLEFVPGTVL